MIGFLPSGRVVDVIIGLVVVEWLALILLRRLWSIGPGGYRMLPNLLAGGSLLLTLRFAIYGFAWPWIASGLLAALISHLWDLAGRWRG